MVGIPLKSTTKSVSEKNFDNSILSFPESKLFANCNFIDSGEKYPFSKVMALCFAAATTKSVWRTKNAGICKTSTP